ncbi:MAG TPA: ribosomal protein S18-alanine N-acetyltransferase [Gemmatimonadales bacterium]|nr:ribosomal protein S18-alanine N-acetyltransferase [Gemmatimonadales bacterium]
MDDPYPIRPAELADVPAILAIERASFSDPWSRQDFIECVNSGVPFLAAGSEGNLAGYIIAHYAADEGEILNLGVRESDRRHGTGRTLVTAMLHALRERGVTSVYLEVRESNAVAQHLYEQLGFIRVGRRRHYYRLPTEDAVVLRVGI